jgi:hypothetical protein
MRPRIAGCQYDPGGIDSITHFQQPNLGDLGEPTGLPDRSWQWFHHEQEILRPESPLFTARATDSTPGGLIIADYVP